MEEWETIRVNPVLLIIHISISSKKKTPTLLIIHISISSKKKTPALLVIHISISSKKKTPALLIIYISISSKKKTPALLIIYISISSRKQMQLVIHFTACLEPWEILCLWCWVALKRDMRLELMQRNYFSLPINVLHSKECVSALTHWLLGWGGGWWGCLIQF